MFKGEGLRIITTLPQTPQIHAICERVIGTLRTPASPGYGRALASQRDSMARKVRSMLWPWGVRIDSGWIWRP
jgi:hypothetical protein